MRGIDEHVWLDVAGERVAGVFEAGRESESKLSAVQYVRFPLADGDAGPRRRRRGADDRRRSSRRIAARPRCRRPCAAVSWRSWTTPRRRAPRSDGCAMAEGVREGRRTTPQLAVVLEAVRTSGAEHPTAERIYDRVRRVLPSISLGTVYRNLQRLVQEGQIGAAQLGARSLHYDPTATPHDHFVCRALRPGRGPDGRCARAAARSGAPRGPCRDVAHARALRPLPELPGVDMRLPDIIPHLPAAQRRVLPAHAAAAAHLRAALPRDGARRGEGRAADRDGAAAGRLAAGLRRHAGDLRRRARSASWRGARSCRTDASTSCCAGCASS